MSNAPLSYITLLLFVVGLCDVFLTKKNCDGSRLSCITLLLFVVTYGACIWNLSLISLGQAFKISIAFARVIVTRASLEKKSYCSLKVDLELPTDWLVPILCIIFHLEHPHCRDKLYVEYHNVLLNLSCNIDCFFGFFCEYITPMTHLHHVICMHICMYLTQSLTLIFFRNSSLLFLCHNINYWSNFILKYSKLSCNSCCCRICNVFFLSMFVCLKLITWKEYYGKIVVMLSKPRAYGQTIHVWLLSS